MKICWADDNLDEARTFAMALDGMTPEITFAADGERALEVLRAGPYDLLIVDLRMAPGEWGGLWLLERLNEVPFPPPALVLSGEGGQPETIEALRLGVADYVEKSKIQDELLDRVAVVVNDSMVALVDAEESESLEFKQTLRVDVDERGLSQREVARQSLASIASFANSSGGTLVVGRSDRGEVRGLERDLETLKERKDLDGFQSCLRDLTTAHMGAATNHLVHIRFPVVRGVTVAVVNVDRAADPIFFRVKDGPAAFYIRVGNKKESLDVAEMSRYKSSHWGQ